MNDHSTIGLVITTDASFGELPRDAYLEAEERTILALKQLKKPFLVLVNSKKPYSEEAISLAAQISDTYDVSAMPINCEQLRKEDIHRILEKILYEFPISSIEFYMPKWVEMLPSDHRIKLDLVERIKELAQGYATIEDWRKKPIDLDGEYIKQIKTDAVHLSDGVIKVYLTMEDVYYYEMLTEMVGEPIGDEYALIAKLKSYASMKEEYEKVEDAVRMVRIKGYGVVTPSREEIVLEDPQLIKQGNKFGVKIKAQSPSIHMIRANIETEIAPIVGTQDQAEDLIGYIRQTQSDNGIWDTNIFGKTVEQLVNDGITAKVTNIGEESQMKLQDTMQKVVNDSNGGMVCIIL
jgi:stage IV sporulation protein A